MMQKVLHYPRLDTVLMVEKILKEADTLITIAELERRLPKQIMYQTLRLILNYLEESGKIYIGSKGISWTYNDNPKFKKMLEKSVRVA